MYAVFLVTSRTLLPLFLVDIEQFCFGYLLRLILILFIIKARRDSIVKGKGGGKPWQTMGSQSDSQTDRQGGRGEEGGLSRLSLPLSCGLREKHCESKGWHDQCMRLF